MTFGLGICDDHSVGCMLAWSVLYAADVFPWIAAGAALIFARIA